MAGKSGHMNPLEDLRADRYRDKPTFPRFVTWGQMLTEGLQYLLLDRKLGGGDETLAGQDCVRLGGSPLFGKLV